MQKIVLASGNEGKLREIQQRLGHKFDFVTQSEFKLETPAETGISFLENAFLKARYVSAKTGLPALADDSGLVVDYLNGDPGIYSARYAGPEAKDEDNNLKILRELAQVPQKSRSAAFHCTMVLIYPQPESSPIICEGIWRGEILTEARGENGFGYDPIFQPEGRYCSSAELEPEQKNRISHRGKAMSMLVERLSKE